MIISWHYVFTPGNIWWGGDYIVTLYFHSWQYLVRGGIISWHYIFTPGNIWRWGDYIVTLYFHSWQYLVREWLYRDVIFSLQTIFGAGVIISWHYIFTPDNIWSGGDHIVTQYIHPWQYLVRGWLYRDTIFSLLAIFGEGVIISWHYIFTPGNIWWGGDYIVTLYFHSWQYLVRGWLYRDIIFSLLTIFGAGVIISWHYIFTPSNIWWGGDYIVTLYFHSWQYLVRGWLYRDIIFSLLTIFGEGGIISWHIFTPDNIWCGGDYIVTLYFHSWQYLEMGWLYRDTIFSLLAIFGEGVIISWRYIFTPDNIWCGGDYIVTLYFHSWQYLVRGWSYRDIIFSLLAICGEGVIISWHYIFTPGNIWWGGDYIVTLYFHSWQYLVRGWLHRDIIFSLLTILGAGVIISWHYIFTPSNIWVRGWLYRDIIFSLLAIFGEGGIISWHYIFTPDNIWCGGGLYRDIIFSLLAIFGDGVIISWHYIFTPGNIWWGSDYIVTLYFHSRQYLVRGWLYRDIIFSLLTIFGQGVIISWHNIFTPDNIWWGGDYIVTLYFHSWQYLVRGWLYRDVIFSLQTIFGAGVIISWHYIFTPDNIWSGGDHIVTQYIHPWQYLVRGWLYRDTIFSFLAIFGEGVIISWHYNIISDTTLESGTGGDYIWIFSLSKYNSAVIHKKCTRQAGKLKFFGTWPNWVVSYIAYTKFHLPRPVFHSPGQIFTRIGERASASFPACQGFIIHIHIFTPWNWGGEVIIFKHDTLFAVET